MEVHIIISIAAVICGIFLGEVFMLGIGHIRAQDTEENYLVNASGIDNIIYDIQKDVSTFNTLLKHMERPAHAVPGDVGEDIHIQHRRVEGFVDAINDNVNCLEKLAEDTTINKEEMRSLVVSLYIQMEKLRGCTTDLGDLINEALAADKEDENALKLQDSLNEFDLAQVEVFEGIGKLETELQDPIDRGYRGRFGALNPKRLDNGNTLIAETVTDRIIEVTPDKEIIWEYVDIDHPTDAERLTNGNTLIADRNGTRIIEVTPDKEVSWEYKEEGLKAVYDVRRL